jgi:hypothetical protein
MSDINSVLRDYGQGYKEGVAELKKSAGEQIAETAAVILTMGLSEIGSLGRSDAFEAGFRDALSDRKFDPKPLLESIRERKREQARVSAEGNERRQPQASCSDSDDELMGWLKLTGGVLAFGLLLVAILFVFMMVVLTSPIWLGAVAVSVITAFLYSKKLLRELPSGALESAAIIDVERRRRLKLAVDRNFLKTSIRWSPHLFIVAGAGIGYALLIGGMLILVTADPTSRIIFIPSVVAGCVLAWRIGKRVLERQITDAVFVARQLRSPKGLTRSQVSFGLSCASVPLFVAVAIAMFLGAFEDKTRLTSQRYVMNPASSVTAESLFPVEDRSLRPSSFTPLATTVPPVAPTAPFGDKPAANSPASTVPTPAALLPQQHSTEQANALPEHFSGEQYPETRTRLLTADEVRPWPHDKVRYAINELFARRGAKFPDKKIQKWFAQFSWYHPVENSSFDEIEQSMSDVERDNVKLLGAARDAKRLATTNASGHWIGILNWKTYNGRTFYTKCDVIFDPALGTVTGRSMSDQGTSDWVTYPLRKNGKTLSWIWPAPEGESVYATYIDLKVDAAGRNGYATSRSVQQGQLLASGSGRFGRNDVALPRTPAQEPNPIVQSLVTGVLQGLSDALQKH